MTDSWVILRTAGRSTLRLADSLGEDGFEVWTPVETSIEHVTSMNAKREVRLPILAGFVFADLRYLVDLLELANMPVKPRRGPGMYKPAHQGFSVFHHYDRIPVVADRDLNPLRRIARRRTATPLAAKPLKKYQRVRALEGAGSFEGMSGTVQISDQRQTVVCFGGLLNHVEIPTSLLRLDEVERYQSATDTAARIAA
jgi:hypothetical protein